MISECIRLYQVRAVSQEHEIFGALSFSINAGETVGILGSSYQQARALIDILTGKLAITSGVIFWNDRLIQDQKNVAKLPISVIRTETSLIMDANICENLFVFRNNHRKGLMVSKKAMHKQADLLLCEFDTKLSATEKVENLSVYQRIVIEIIRAVLSGAKLIIIGVPLESLKPEQREQWLKLLSKLKKRSISVLIIDSVSFRISEFADKLLIIDDGNVRSFFQYENEWAKRYIDNSALPVAVRTSHSTQKKIVFKVDNLQIGDEFSPVTFQLYEGELSQMCDAGHDLNRRLINHLFPNGFCTVTSNGKTPIIRLLSSQIERYFAQDLSPLDNLCLSLYPRLSHASIIRSRSVKYLAQAFSNWYEDDSIFQRADRCEKLSDMDKVTLILYRFLMEGAQVIFCEDLRNHWGYQDYNKYLAMLRRLTDCYHISICTLTSDSSDIYEIYDRCIDLTPFHSQTSSIRPI